MSLIKYSVKFNLKNKYIYIFINVKIVQRNHFFSLQEIQNYNVKVIIISRIILKMYHGGIYNIISEIKLSRMKGRSINSKITKKFI